MKTRETNRRKACLSVLKNRSCLLSELRWRVWTKELALGSTKVACPRSSDYQLSFDRSLKRWEEQKLLYTSNFKIIGHPITYGIAARLAVYTALERGLMSSDSPAERICLYFGQTWCSVLITSNDGLNVNLGAILVSSVARYQVVSIFPIKPSTTLLQLSDVAWRLYHAVSGEVLNAREEFDGPKLPKKTLFGRRGLEESEIRAKEGVALAIKRHYPGGISPYTQPGEWTAVGPYRG